MTVSTPMDRRFKVVFALGITAILTSVGVFTHAFLSWRAGIEGWRAGANVNLMRSAATTIALALSTFVTLRAVRTPAASQGWRPHVASYSLLAAAIVLLLFTVKWSMHG